MARTVIATVAAISPLTLYFDGDSTHAVPAVTVSTYTPVAGHRVRTELRTPLPPIVQYRVK